MHTNDGSRPLPPRPPGRERRSAEDTAREWMAVPIPAGAVAEYNAMHAREAQNEYSPHVRVPDRLAIRNARVRVNR